MIHYETIVPVGKMEGRRGGRPGHVSAVDEFNECDKRLS